MRTALFHHMTAADLAPSAFSTLAITAAGTYALSTGTTAALADSITGAVTLTSAHMASVSVIGGTSGDSGYFNHDSVSLEVSTVAGAICVVHAGSNDTIAGSGIQAIQIGDGSLIAGNSDSYNGTIYSGGSLSCYGDNDTVNVSLGGGGHIPISFGGSANTMGDVLTVGSSNDTLSFSNNVSTLTLTGTYTALSLSYSQLTITDFNTAGHDTVSLGGLSIISENFTPTLTTIGLGILGGSAIDTLYFQGNYTGAQETALLACFH